MPETKDLETKMLRELDKAIEEGLRNPPDIAAENLAKGYRVSYIDPEKPDVITLEYPDGRKEYRPLDDA